MLCYGLGGILTISCAGGGIWGAFLELKLASLATGMRHKIISYSGSGLMLVSTFYCIRLTWWIWKKAGASVGSYNLILKPVHGNLEIARKPNQSSEPRQP